MANEGELIAGRYRLLAHVGTGAMGVVWQAHDERLDRIVAVKQLLPRSGMSEAEAAEATRRAMREGRITARLHHPHAINVYDVAEHEDQPCLIMEYLPSESLATVLGRRGPLPAEDVARIGSQIADALASAHEVGIVHRDIKPGNVLLSGDGIAKITDFGISRTAGGDGTVTATGVLPGTPAYLAPEVARGQAVDFPADVFSLGATLYAAVEGRPPFGVDDNPLALLHRVATSEIAPPVRAGALTPVLLRLLERTPSQRPTMRQAQQALSAAAGSTTAVAHGSPDPVPASTGIPTTETATTETAATGISLFRLPVLGSSTGSDASSPRPSSTGSRNRLARRAALAITAVTVTLIVAGVVGVSALSSSGEPSAGQDPLSPPDTTQGAPAQPPAPQLQPPPATETSTRPETTTAPETTGRPAPGTTPATTAAPATTTAGPPRRTPGQPAAAIADYYTLMPTNLQQGWPRLTADYQRNHAGGFSGYQAFWRPVQRVETSGVTSTSPTTVDATITYFFRDGRVITEQTSFGLVVEDGRWKIASSAVNSSRTRQE